MQLSGELTQIYITKMLHVAFKNLILNLSNYLTVTMKLDMISNFSNVYSFIVGDTKQAPRL